MPRDVFISYASRDREVAAIVKQQLEQHGVSTFYDQDALRPGLPWLPDLERALSDVRAVVILVGSTGLGPIQKREYWCACDRQSQEEAHETVFPMVPVLLPGAEPSFLPGFLAQQTWIDLRTDMDAGIRRLARAVDGSPLADRSRLTPSCPYRGLEHFREEDEALYFGRTAIVDALVGKVLQSRLVTVIGSSGAGKSSLVRAGLLPRLGRRRSPAWDRLLMTPGKRPFHSLAPELVGSWAEPGRTVTDLLAESEELGSRLLQGSIPLRAALERALLSFRQKNGALRLLLVIDQLEELFTLASPSERWAFVDRLLEALDTLPSLSVLITVRADFYASLLDHRALGDRLDGAVLNLGPPTRQELRMVVEEPAALAGLEFAEGLIARLVEDAGSEIGSLPLLRVRVVGALASPRRTNAHARSLRHHWRRSRFGHGSR
jgi:hypothetical protein